MIHVMSGTPRLPDDPGECQRLLLDLLRRNDELRQQAEDARRRVAELERAPEETAADYSQLQERHAELAETLALFRRYIFGPRRERLGDDPGQGHLFDLHDAAGPPGADAAPGPESAASGGRTEATSPRRRTTLD